MAPLILATDILRLPIAALGLQGRVGKVKDVLIDAERGIFEGVTVTVDWLAKPKFVAVADIFAIDERGITVKSPDDVVDLGEVLRAKAIFESKFRMIGLAVVTQSGKRLGKITDLVISTQTGRVVKFYVGSFLSDRVIPWEKVIKVERKKMIVDDDFELAKAASAMAAEGA